MRNRTITINMNPGSPPAKRAGCLCPVDDNNHGRGSDRGPGTFWVVDGCPLHGSNPISDGEVLITLPSMATDSAPKPQEAPATVSLADAPAQLRRVAGFIRTYMPGWDEDGKLHGSLTESEALEALASSLEQQIPATNLTEAERKALLWAMQLMGDCRATETLFGLLQRLQAATNICLYEDTVTFILSRKDAADVAFLTEKEGRTFEEWAHTYAAAGHEVRSRGHDESAARWKNITNTIRGAGLQPTTPERRE
jgi:hypothetical protein